MAWAGSDRKSRLPADWPKRRRIVLDRDPVCQLRTHCTGAPSTEVDHRDAGDDHRLSNLQGVCGPCHKHKTATERPSQRRANEAHPGLL